MTRPALPADVANALEAFAAWARASFGDRLYRLALFGSFARGEGSLPDSDVDVLVALDGMSFDEMVAIAQRGGEIGATYHLAFTPLPMSGDEFRKLQRQQRLLAREIDQDGIAL